MIRAIFVISTVVVLLNATPNEPSHEAKLRFAPLYGIPHKDTSLEQYFDYVLSRALVLYHGTPSILDKHGHMVHVADILNRIKVDDGMPSGFQLFASEFDKLLQIQESPEITREGVASTWKKFEKDLTQMGHTLGNIIPHSLEDFETKTAEIYLFHGLNKIRDLAAMKKKWLKQSDERHLDQWSHVYVLSQDRQNYIQTMIISILWNSIGCDCRVLTNSNTKYCNLMYILISEGYIDAKFYGLFGGKLVFKHSDGNLKTSARIITTAFIEHFSTNWSTKQQHEISTKMMKALENVLFPMFETIMEEHVAGGNDDRELAFLENLHSAGNELPTI